MYDLILKGGLVIDGSGSKAYSADIAVAQGRIAEIAPSITGDAVKIVDVSGLAVSPGFIDIHSHSDTSFLTDERCQSKLFQGVTSELAGQCGSTPFPAKDSGEADDPVDGFYADSMAQYISKCQNAGKRMSTNLMLLTGHGDLRTYVMGPDDREATGDEISRMQQILDTDMQGGGWGLSLGLGYAPGVSSDQNELNRLGEIVAKHGGIITSHMRDQEQRTPQSLEEMFNIYRHCGAHVHIAHFKAYGKACWGRAPEFMDILRHARQDGVNVTVDVYPYTAASSGITNAWPAWAVAGGFKEAVARTNPKHPDYQRLRDELCKIYATPEDGDTLFVVTTNGKMPEADGKTIRQIARELDMEIVDAQLEVTRRTEAGASCIMFGMSEEDVLYFLSQPDIVIGSDGSNYPIDSDEPGFKHHPRNFGTFPRFLRLCREHKLCGLESAVHRITGRTAQILGLEGRGLLRPGSIADITVFDPDKISDNATFTDPVQKNNGIIHVLLEGRFAIENSIQTELRAGQFLLKK